MYTFYFVLVRLIIEKLCCISASICERWSKLAMILLILQCNAVFLR